MKTEIIYQHNLEEGFAIHKVIPLNNNSCALLYSKYPDIFKVDIIGEHPKTFIISEYKEISADFEGKCLFRYNETVGLIDYTNTLLLWNDINNPELLKISNSFPADKHNRKYHTKIATFDEVEKSIYFGIEDISRYGFPSRFWAKLDLNENSIFGIKLSGIKAKWNSKYELDVSDYPPTEFGKYGDDWLNINDLMIKDHYLYTHTNGGSSTRLKSGKDYEFSIISKLTKKNQLVEKFNIEEGKGFFTSSKEYFLLHKRKNKKRISFYNTNNFEIDFEVSLTPKQNLADGSSNFLITDFFEGNLFLYNARFFNICRLTE